MCDQTDHVKLNAEAIEQYRLVRRAAEDGILNLQRTHPEAIASVLQCITWHRELIRVWELVATLAQAQIDLLEAENGRYSP